MPSGDVSPDGQTIYSFDGGDESFVSVNQPLNFLPSLGFTIAGWIRQTPQNTGYGVCVCVWVGVWVWVGVYDDVGV